jgi:DNA-binding IclR family transcriptional regulator
MDDREASVEGGGRPAEDELAGPLGHGGAGRGVLDGAFRLLQALPDIGGPGQLGQLARVTGIPRPTVYRLMAQLCAVGAVERRHDRYLVGTAMVNLASRVEPETGLRRDAAEVMRALREQTGATVSLVAPVGTGGIVLDVIVGRERLPVDIYAGCEMPAASAGGLVLHPRAADDRIRSGHRAAVDDEHTIPGLTCYAVGITLRNGTAVALQLSSTTNHNATQLAPLARQAADRIASRIRPAQR